MNIDIQGVKLNYEVHGDGIPVLMLHGFRMSAKAMGQAIEPLFDEKAGYQRIYPDMPGMGLSTRPDTIQTSDDIVDVISEFVDEIIGENHFLLGGFSYGGYIARAILKRYQQQVDGLFLLAPTVLAIDAERDLPETQNIVKDPEAVTMIPEPFRPLMLSATAVVTKPVIQRTLDEIVPALQMGDMQFLESVRQPENFHLKNDIDTLDMPFDKPALIITGRQDAAVGYANAFTLSRNYPRATYIAVDRAGHAIYMEQPALVNFLFSEWLDRVKEAKQITVPVL